MNYRHAVSTSMQAMLLHSYDGEEEEEEHENNDDDGGNDDASVSGFCLVRWNRPRRG